MTFEHSNRVIGLIGDKVRGERNNVSKDPTRVMRAYAIPIVTGKQIGRAHV